jgi:hypothetical protein
MNTVGTALARYKGERTTKGTLMKKLAALFAALLAVIGLSGCVVVPAYEPGYRTYDRTYYGSGYYEPGYRYYGGRRGYY